MTTINLYNLDELESKHKNDFDKILTENIINFHNLLDRKEKYFDNMDWYLSLPYSKNTLISNLYKKFCLIILCKKILLSSNNIKEIIVENNQFCFCKHNFSPLPSTSILSTLFLSDFLKYFIKRAI